MSWLSDFIGGVTGKSQQDATASAANKSNKNAEKYRGEAIDALNTGNADLAALMPFLQAGGSARMAEIEDLLKRVFGDMSAGNTAINGAYDTAINGAKADAGSSKAAIEQEFQDSLRTGVGAVQRSYAGTGLGTSTLVPSQVATNIVPNAVGSKMRALATLDNGLADRVTSLQARRADTTASRANLGTQIMTDTLGKKIDLANTYFGQEMNLREAPIRNRLNTLAQPNAIYPNLTFPATVSGASAAGSTLGGIGAGIAGQYFNGVGQNAGMSQSIKDLIAALQR